MYYGEFTYFYFISDGDLYTGTVADFSGMDPIIYREPLQTEQYDSMSLNGESSTVYIMLCSREDGRDDSNVKKDFTVKDSCGKWHWSRL